MKKPMAMIRMRFKFQELIITAKVEDKLKKRNLNREIIEGALESNAYAIKFEHEGEIRHFVFAEYNGRILTIILNLNPYSTIRLISARDSTDSEKVLFRKKTR